MKPNNLVAVGACRFDPASGVLYRDGEERLLPPRVAAVLTALLGRPGELITKRALMDAVWKGTCVTDGSLLEAISALREALGDDPQHPTYIQTVHRRGYRLIAEPARRKPFFVGADLLDRRSLVGGGQVGPWADPKKVRPYRSASVLATMSVVVAILAVALWITGRPARRRPAPLRPVSRFVVPLAQDSILDAHHPAVTISPDGRLLAYVAVRGGTSRLFVRPMDEIEPSALVGTEGASDPFFSPDGRWIGFFAEGHLKKVLAAGSTPVTLCEARNDFGASWSPGGTIVFASRLTGGLLAVSDQGEKPTAITTIDSHDNDVRHVWPQVLPNGRDVIFAAQGVGRSRLAIASLATGRAQTLVDGASFGRYSPSGHLVVARGSELEAAPFDLDRRTITGTSKRLIGGVATSAVTGAAHFAFSTNGSLVYVPAVAGDGKRPWPDDDGPSPLQLPSRSLTDVLELLPSRFNQFPSSWGPDGQVITFTELNPDTGADIWLLSLPDHRARPLVRTPFDETTARFSADGHWIAYSSNEGADWSVYVQPFPGPGPRVHLDVRGGHSPYWSPDGRRLFFLTPEGLMWVPIETGSGRLAFGAPTLASPLASSRELQVILEWFQTFRQ